MRTTLIFVFFLLVCVSTGLSQDVAKGKTKTIKGTVIAENVSNRFLTCWHVCGLRLIVKLEGSKTSEYAIVSVTFMDDRNSIEKGPHWKLVEETGKWKFKASAGNPPTVVLNQFATTTDMKTGRETTQEVRMTEWLLLKGSEHVKLPFGQSIPSYSVDVDDFKSIK